MNENLVQLPSINANDSTAKLVEWLVDDREEVDKGDAIAIIETTKASIEVEAPVTGFCAHLHKEGVTLAEETVIAVILEVEDEKIEQYLEIIASKTKKNGVKKWTKKAALIAKKSDVDIDLLAKTLGRQVKESDVINFRDPGISIMDLVDDEYPTNRRERVLLIGGGGGGGTIALDAIARTKHQRAVGILDNNESLQGKTLMGIPVLGVNNLVKKLWKEKKFDAAIIIVTANLDQRQRLFQELKSQNIPFTNVIDPLAQIMTNVSLGIGNLIMPNCFIAACVKIGDNNFMASHVCIEHHSTVGNHCTFGPRTTTSGAVVIGNRVKFGMGVLVEPYLTIGNDTIIPSGIVINNSVSSNSTLKVKRNYTL